MFNAKEKLLSYVKNTKIDVSKSNKWNLMIDIANIRNLDNEEMNITYRIVKDKEQLIMKTEMMMQETSIYSDSYKPLFIYEMDENSLKEFSKQLNQKLRHVKLAISKANLGQNKYKSEADELSQHQDIMASNMKSDFLKKHRLDKAMFNKSIQYFGKSKFPKELKLETEEKQKGAKAKLAEKSVSKDKYEGKRLITEPGMENTVGNFNFSKGQIETNFQFYPSASISAKLPEIINNKKYVNKKIQEVIPNRKITSIVNYQSIQSKYKSKDKMSVGEVFDSYQVEYRDFLNSLINPMSKLSKLTKKDGTYLNKILTSDLTEDVQSYQIQDCKQASKYSEEASSVELKKN